MHQMATTAMQVILFSGDGTLVALPALSAPLTTLIESEREVLRRAIAVYANTEADCQAIAAALAADDWHTFWLHWIAEKNA